jgi:hypothetical protein
MASPSQRRSAQRRLAREIHKGLYGSGMPRRTEAGRAYEHRVSHFTVEVGKTGVKHHQRQFRTLDNALKFAGDLPPSQKSYIVAKGDYRNPNKYAQKSSGYAGISGWAQGDYYAAFADDIKDSQSDIFVEGSTTSYYVRWTDIK